MEIDTLKLILKSGKTLELNAKVYSKNCRSMDALIECLTPTDKSRVVLANLKDEDTDVVYYASNVDYLIIE